MAITGWINARLKYVREQQNKLNQNPNEATDNNNLDEVIMTDDMATDDILFLKSLVVCEDNMVIFIQKLNATRSYRQKMLLDKSIHLKEQFPYFFTHPHLVTSKLSIIWFCFD